jgi:hypothetical protein
VGDTVVVNGEEFEVVWSGGEGLVAVRETKSTGFWTPPKRLYNKKSDYWKNLKKKVDNPIEETSDSETRTPTVPLVEMD